MFNKEVIFEFGKSDKRKRTVNLVKNTPVVFDICSTSPQPCTLDMKFIGKSDSFLVEDTIYKTEMLLFFYIRVPLTDNVFILDAKEEFQDFSLIDKNIEKKPNKNAFPLKDKNPNLVFGNGKRKKWN